MPKSRGFTLVELLVTISIIAILSAMGLIAYSTVLKQGRDSKRQSDLRSIQSALEQYNSDQGAYPASIPTDGSSLTAGGKTYLNQTPVDSDSTKSYYYNPNALRTSYDLCAALDITPSSPANCGAARLCGVDCNFKVTPP